MMRAAQCGPVQIEMCGSDTLTPQQYIRVCLIGGLKRKLNLMRVIYSMQERVGRSQESGRLASTQRVLTRHVPN